MPSVLSIVIALFGIYRYGPWWLRAIRRRRATLTPSSGRLDPLITAGLRSLPWLTVIWILVGALMPLRLYLAWPRWVGLLSTYLIYGLTLALFIVMAVLGVRIAQEERRFGSNAQVT